jgi:hypothetical protein
VSRQVRGWQLSYEGYRRAGYDHNDALGWTISTNAPLIGSFYKGAEMRYGVSFQGTNFGDKLTTGDYILNTVHIGVDVATTALGGKAVGIRLASPLRATTMLGRTASRFRTAAEMTGYATGQVTPWGMYHMTAGSVRRAHGVVEGGLNKVVHGWMKDSRWHDPTAGFLNRVGFKVCFAAGTPLRTPDGSKLIEQFRPGDLVLSRDEHDPEGLVVARLVEEVFVRQGLIWHLHVGGQVIRTTAEHPFYVASRGWAACHELKVGDLLLCADATWAAVEDLLDTGEWETVYNLRVADFHTYFVGCDEWGFSVWAHNQCTQAEFEAALRVQGYSQKAAATAWNRFKLGDVANRDVPGLWKYLTDNQRNARPKLNAAEADRIVHLLTGPSRGPTSSAPTWWDGGLTPVGGPNPNGLRQRAVTGPTPREGGVYLKSEGGSTKVGSADDFAGRYGRSATDGIEVEIPQTRFGKPLGVDDSAYPWTPRGQRRFDEEYVDRLLPPEVKYRDPDRPIPPVSQEKWARYRHIFGYGDLHENFGR